MSDDVNHQRTLGGSQRAEAIRMPDPYALLGLDRGVFNAPNVAVLLRNAAAHVEGMNPEGNTSVTAKSRNDAQYHYAVFQAALDYVKRDLVANRQEYFRTFKFNYDAATGEVRCFNRDPEAMQHYMKLLSARGIHSSIKQLDSVHGPVEVVCSGAADLVQSELAEYLPADMVSTLHREEAMAREYISLVKPVIIRDGSKKGLYCYLKQVQI